MDIFLVIISLFLMVLGLVGSFLPVLPGPLTSWVGLLVLHFTNGIELSKTLIFTTLIFAIFIWLLDYVIPAIGTKRFGGSKSGMVGTTLGLVIGLISPIPFGIIIGPFVGAFIGEMLHKEDVNRASKAAFGSFLGFITSTFLKFIVAIVYFGFFITKLGTHTGPWW
ncbi:DUF456 domain-containing protein [Winogradskyella immobilis]|uniref:DUF456 domain-containing protein n=1 Tax=Winogradskyella immobilis TaxID=2816852 RepID=A0ABS8EL85_9FLAO|nr:DUF456 domain-containing protein [Winogradskyella immobilis]MCC1483072.1 DUF456 domain-containing protein [Winogradskyella immobilis]MCG0015167.1 DUF456 domain-containing protein [Winogradskyella immobilis]